jgi:hypothetical protein
MILLKSDETKIAAQSKNLTFLKFIRVTIFHIYINILF